MTATRNRGQSGVTDGRGIRRPRSGSEAGVASVEFVGGLPLMLIVMLLAAQLLIAGGALWSASLAARAGARAAHIGDSVEGAARDALPTLLRDGLKVAREDGGVNAEVSVPRVLPVIPKFEVAARSSLE